MQQQHQHRNRQANSGALFKNDRKETDTQPDYRGNATIAGVDYWVSSWINTSASGSKYMSLSYQVKDVPQPQCPPASASQMGVVRPTHTEDDLDDDIPF